ncbi:unnamed protein product, partial [Mesorhabditis belari]
MYVETEHFLGRGRYNVVYKIPHTVKEVFLPDGLIGKLECSFQKRNQIDYTNAARLSLEKESELLKVIDHANIVKCFGWMTISFDEHNIPKTVMLLQKCRRETLNDVVMSDNYAYPKPTVVVWCAAQLIQVLIYLRANKIVHKDITLKNILISEETMVENRFILKLKLCDFEDALVHNETPEAFADVRNGIHNSPEIWTNVMVGDFLRIGKVLWSAYYRREFPNSRPRQPSVEPRLQEGLQ